MSDAVMTPLDSLPLLPGETAESLAHRGGVRGFAYVSPSDDVRYQTNYQTPHEKAWCECNDLCDHGLWEEARLKLDEVERETPTPALDMQMAARVFYGYAMHKANHADERLSENDYQAAAQTLRVCAQVPAVVIAPIDDRAAQPSSRVCGGWWSRARSPTCA